MSPSTEINYEASGRRPHESSSKLKSRHLYMIATGGIFSTILTEMAAAVPLNGAGTDYYPTRFLSKSFGFAMGYNYWFAYAILVPFEITVSTLVIHYWNPPVHDAVFLTILLVVVVRLNYLPVKDSVSIVLPMGFIAEMVALSSTSFQSSSSP
uniref:Amino acid permease/ SLC12A domain-containing protein n=1 Tax=Fusarium oxysporum (strain Fo5176) TaxID=660025 RepID=A0A0D2XY23_FUSOF